MVMDTIATLGIISPAFYAVADNPNRTTFGMIFCGDFGATLMEWMEAADVSHQNAMA